MRDDEVHKIPFLLYYFSMSGGQPNDSTQSDTARLEESLNQVVISGTRWLTAVLAAVFGVYIIFNLKDLDDPAVQAVTIYDVILLVIFVTLKVAQVRNRIPLHLANPLIAAIAALVISNVLFTVLIYEDPTDLHYLPLILIGPGSFMLSYRWLFVSLTVTIAAAIPVAWQTLDQTALINFCFSAFAGAAMSAAIHVYRLRTQRHLVTLRIKDVEQAASLKRALDAAEEELKERERAESKRQQLEDQLRQSQKMEAVGLLAGGIAHDMNNVLGAITALVSTIQTELRTDDPRNGELEEILDAAKRGSKFTRNLLGFARKGNYEMREISVNRTVRDVQRLLERTIPKKISISVVIEDDLDRIQGDPSQMTQVLMNLCLNSVDAMQGHGQLTIATENTHLDAENCTLHPDLEPGRYVKITIEDTGQGIDQASIERVFDPFFTTKPSGEGTGLGLSMVYGTIRNHRGVVSLDSELGRGTRVTLLLPSQMRTGPSVIPARPSSTLDRGAGVILLVDDDPLIQSSATRLLTSLGYEVLVASDGQQALEVYGDNRDRILLVILDVNMPVMDGIECHRKLRALDPVVRVLVSSGFAEGEETETMMEQGAAGFIGKPYERDSMAEAITDVLADASVNTAVQ